MGMHGQKVLSAYAGLCDSKLAVLMTSAERNPEPACRNVTLKPRSQKASVQLFFILIMPCRNVQLNVIVNSGQGVGVL